MDVNDDASIEVRTDWRRIVVAVAVLVLIVIGVRASGISSTGELKASVESLGAWAFVGFVVAYALAVIALLPASALTIAAGLLFGAVIGSVLVVVAATLGAAGAFLLARSSARPLAMRFAGRYVDRLDDLVGDRTFSTVLLVRLLPIVPFSASNYALGLARFQFGRYVLATALGIVPGTVAYVSFGSSLGQVGSPAFWISIVALTLLTLVTGLVARRIQRRTTTDTK